MVGSPFMILPSTNATFSPSLRSHKSPPEERFQRRPLSQSQWPPRMRPRRGSAPPESCSKCERAARPVNHGGIVYQMLAFGLSFEAILVFVVDAQNL